MAYSCATYPTTANQAFVKAIVDVARGMNKGTIAEFVESAETLAMLQQFGVDMVQSYYLDTPRAAHPALKGKIISSMIAPSEILDFWYAQEMRSKWFASTPQLDAAIKEKYARVWEAALRGALDTWRDTPAGCLALAIILDQFPLNMFRATAKSFSSEHQAIAVTKHAIGQGYDQLIERAQVAFLYMPLMHSENLADQDLCVQLFAAAGLENNLRFAQHHREIVRRFGRFPHRNAILGRPSTPEELNYLDSKEAFHG